MRNCVAMSPRRLNGIGSYDAFVALRAAPAASLRHCRA